MQPLPIDVLIPQVLAALKESPALVLQAAPGAGKTTRVPRALLEHGVARGKEVVVLEPRRLATRLAAQRVAEELGEAVGGRVGYQVRFEDVSGSSTRLRFVTEGILGRRLVAQPRLDDVGVVVLDEFHERHLAGDVALALLRRLQRTDRPDLKIVVMSATLEPAPLAAYLGGCPALFSEGRRFDVALEHLPVSDERPLEQQVLGALKRLEQQQATGHVLAFLPGAGGIRRTHEACAEFAGRHGLTVLPLHGDLSSAEQDRAVKPSRERKLILSTNVAETSVTIEGVTAVIDSGLARVASFSPWSGLPALKLSKISRASCLQRAGRAGRTQAGRCVRLYTAQDFENRVEHDAPEIRRLDLAETVLSLRSLGIPDLAQFDFFEPPPRAALENAELLLRRLGAVGHSGEVTAVGRRLLRLPLHPRQARVVAEGERRGVAEAAVLCAALLGERDVRMESRTRFAPGGGSRGGSAASVSGPSDVLEMLERLEQAAAGGMNPQRLRSLGLEPSAAQAVDRVRRQLSRGLDRSQPKPAGGAARDEALLLCLLAGYPDRVARRRKPHAPELLLFGGGTAQLSETSVVREPTLLVALDAEERNFGRGNQVVVRLASEVQAEWLLDLVRDALEEVDTLLWSPDAERVERVTRLAYGNLTLEETRAPAPPSEGASRVLAEAALAAGLGRFVDEGELAHFGARLEFAARASPAAGLPSPTPDFYAQALSSLCQGLRSFRELRESPVLELLRSSLSPEHQRLLQSTAPERMTLPGGRPVQIHYEPGKPPWIESRLQDFFGLGQGPVLGQGRVPLVIDLLAPNHRAVQVTTDLAGFWERHYPAVRKELSRKYPRHAWPEDPLSAKPSPPVARRPPGKR